jgi:17beta-estradiol 17-dehydrogenase / very-long-chain 3-oxoacyl-CoA reductase
MNLINRYGSASWVLVTGATDGIGKALCEDLAMSGFNIILVSRTLSKLKKVADDIKNANPEISTQCIEYDFEKRNTLNDYLEVFSNLQEKYDISILINNVGTEQHNTFEQVRINYMFTTLNLNVIPQTILTKIFYTGMNTRKNKSAIINLSSFAGEFPFPMKSLYSATKVFNHYLSIGLMEETKLNSNIDWLSVKPLEVETVLSTTKADGITVITARKCAESLLNDLGYEDETYTHWTHKIQAFILLNLIPRRLMYAVFRRFWFRIFIIRDEKTD